MTSTLNLCQGSTPPWQHSMTTDIGISSKYNSTLTLTSACPDTEYKTTTEIHNFFTGKRFHHSIQTWTRVAFIFPLSPDGRVAADTFPLKNDRSVAVAKAIRIYERTRTNVVTSIPTRRDTIIIEGTFCYKRGWLLRSCILQHAF